MKILWKIRNRFYYPCIFCGKRDNKVCKLEMNHPDIPTQEWKFHWECLKNRVKNSTKYDEKEVVEARNILSYYAIGTGFIKNLLEGKKVDGNQETEGAKNVRY